MSGAAISGGLIIGVLFGIFVLILVLWVVGIYNGFVKLRNLVQESWRQIDVELHRRHELIPNLVQTVKGYAAHEQGVYEAVTQARAQAVGGPKGPAAQAVAENQLSGALGRLFAVSEGYPDLKASVNFLQLQTELTNTEDRIAAGRRFYNANVRELNTKVESFPQNVIAGMFNFTKAEYFEVTDPRAFQAPDVQF